RLRAAVDGGPDTPDRHAPDRRRDLHRRGHDAGARRDRGLPDAGPPCRHGEPDGRAARTVAVASSRFPVAGDGIWLASNGGMTSRSAVFLLTLILSGRAAPPAGTPDFLDGDTTATLTLEAPLKDLFERGAEDENVAVPGTVTFKDASGKDVVFRDVKVSVRGHTSRREAECTFPKLKLKFPDKASLKIGTHCGENAGETLSTKYGRLANELSPQREALVYRLLHAVEAPTLRARPARITYVDAGQRLERNALLLEDDDDALKRFGGEREVTMESFGDVKARNAASDAARIAFAEAMIGNFDWCMRFAPDDIYRCNQPKPLWNVLAFERGDGRTGLAIKDFDLAGTVVGGHPW